MRFKIKKRQKYHQTTRVLIQLTISISFLFLLALPTRILAIPATIDWGSFDTQGSDQFGVYDEDNATILESGDLVQLIATGANGVIDPPLCTGQPGGDDLLLDTSQVNNGAPFPPPFQNKGYIALKSASFEIVALPADTAVYMRAWNGETAVSATAFGNSETTQFENGGTFNAPRWQTDQSFNRTRTRWQGDIGGSWSNGQNWSGGTAPDASSEVVIDNGQVLLDRNVEVSCLIIEANATLDLNSFSLAVANALLNDGILKTTVSVDNASTSVLQITNGDGSRMQYTGVEIISSDNLAEVTVSIQPWTESAVSLCPTQWLAFAGRCFHLSNNGSTGVHNAAVKIWPDPTTLIPQSEETLPVVNYTNGRWETAIVLQEGAEVAPGGVPLPDTAVIDNLVTTDLPDESSIRNQPSTNSSNLSILLISAGVGIILVILGVIYGRRRFNKG